MRTALSALLTLTSALIMLNSQVSFFIFAGNDDNHFHIEESTGRLSVVQPLDYEETTLYSL